MTKRVDRRIQRTRALLRDALMELIIEQGYDEISIQDITDRANVARTTFYLHFKDKDELLFNTLRDIYEDLLNSAILPPMNDLTGTESDCDARDFKHVQQFADFYRVMLSERGSMAFYVRVQTFLAERVMLETLKEIAPTNQMANVPLEVMAWAAAGAHIAVIKWWLDHDMPYPAQHIAFKLQQFLTRGFVWGLGLNLDELLQTELDPTTELG